MIGAEEPAIDSRRMASAQNGHALFIIDWNRQRLTVLPDGRQHAALAMILLPNSGAACIIGAPQGI